MTNATTTLTDSEATLLENLKSEGEDGILRIFMDKQEIRDVKTLVALGLAKKGVSADRQGTVIFHAHEYLNLHLKNEQYR